MLNRLTVILACLLTGSIMVSACGKSDRASGGRVVIPAAVVGQSYADAVKYLGFDDDSTVDEAHTFSIAVIDITHNINPSLPVGMNRSLFRTNPAEAIVLTACFRSGAGKTAILGYSDTKTATPEIISLAKSGAYKKYIETNCVPEAKTFTTDGE